MSRSQKQEKETYSVKQAWVTLAMVVAVSFLFGLVVLPQLDRSATSRLEGEPAPDFALPVTHGGEAGNRIRLSNLSGQVVLLDFWASWCPPCLEQIPVLSKLAAATEGAAVSIVGINTGDGAEAAEKVLARLSPAYPSVVDADGSVGAAYGVETLPTLVVIAPSGKVHAVRQGVHSVDELKQLIRGAENAEPN